LSAFVPVNIGFGNTIMANRIVAVLSPESAPIKRLIQQAKEKDSAIDATYGRRTRSVIITDCGLIVLCALQAETVSARVQGRQAADDEDSQETQGV